MSSPNGTGERAHSSAGMDQSGRSVHSFAFHFLVYWVFVVATIAIDPFGAGASTSRHSQNILLRVLGPDYPDAFKTPFKAEPAADRPTVAVVLVDERSLEKLTLPGNTRKWPAALSQHAMNLEAILVHKPRAVLVDLFFVDPLQGKSGYFKRVLEKYEEEKTPLFFAGIGERTEEDLAASGELPPLLAEKLAPKPPTPVTPELFDLIRERTYLHVVPVTADPDSDGTFRHYPMRGVLNGAGEFKSAAAALYDVLDDRPPIPAEGTMVVAWTTRVDPVNRRWMTCDSTIEFLHLRAIQSLIGPDKLLQQCPAIATVPILELRIPSKTIDEDANRMIKGNFVVYGADVDGEDTYVTPVSPHMPGVYLHAMALDNLLKFEKDYLRKSVTVGRITLTPFHFTMLMGAPAAAFLSALYFRYGAPSIERRCWCCTFGARTILVTLTLIVNLAISYFLVTELRIFSVDWIGPPLFGLTVIALNEQRQINRLLPRFIHSRG